MSIISQAQFVSFCRSYAFVASLLLAERNNSWFCSIDRQTAFIVQLGSTQSADNSLNHSYFMKLHIPRRLRAALLAAISASSAWADVIPYTGTIYTWEGTSNSFHQGSFYATTQNEDGSFTTQEEPTGNWNRDFCSASTSGGNQTSLDTANTLRFAAGATFPTVNYTFTPLAVGGFIIESDTAVRQMSGGNRVIRFGNSSDVAAYSTILSDFTLSGGTSTTYLRGTQHWHVGEEAIFTLTSPAQTERSLSITGEGTVKFGNVLTVNNDASLTLSSDGTLQISNTMVNNGTLNLAGTVDLQGFANVPAATAPAAGTNGFATRAGFSLTVVSGSGTVTGADTVTWKVQGDAPAASAVSFSNGVLQVQESPTTIYYVQADDSVVERSATSLPTASGFVVSSSGNTLTLKEVSSHHLPNGISFNSTGTNTLVIDSGSRLSGADLARTGGTLNATLNGSLTIIGTAVRVNGSMNIGAGGELSLQAVDALGYQGGGDYTDSIAMQGSADAPALLNVSRRQTMSTLLELNGYSSVVNAADAVTTGDQVAGFEAFGYSITATGTDNLIETRLMGRGGNDVEINVMGESDELEIAGAILPRAGQGDSDYIKTGQGTLILSYGGNDLTRLYEHRSGVTQITGQTLMQQGFTVADGTLSVAQGGELTSGTGVTALGKLEVDGLLRLSGESTLAQLSGSGVLDVSGNEVSLGSSVQIGAVLADSVTMSGAEGARNLTLTSSTMNSSVGTLSAVETLTIGPAASLTVSDALYVQTVEMNVGTLTPLLTVGALHSSAADGKVQMNAVAADALLLGMAHGDTITLASITDNNADLTLTVNGTADYELVNDSGFRYTYALTEQGTSGVEVVLTAARDAVGWIGMEGDTWSDASSAEWVGTPPSASEPARFFGDGTGAVRVDAAGVTASRVLVSADGMTTAYTFSGGKVNTSVLAVSAGSLTINNSVEVKKDYFMAGASGLVVVGDAGSLSVASGGSLLVEDELQVQGNGTLRNAGSLTVATLNAPDTLLQNTGTLTVSSGSLSGISGGTLVLEAVGQSEVGTLSVGSDVTLTRLSGNGRLDVGTHDVTLSSADGAADVSARHLTILSGGSSLGDVDVETLLLGGDISLNSTDAPLQVVSMNSGYVRVSDAVFSTIPTAGDGMYAEGDYLLVRGAGAGMSFDDKSRLQAVRRFGLTADALLEEGTLLLRIEDTSTPMTWNTADGNRVTSNGYVVPEGAGFYKALDYVEKVLVSGDVSFNLAAPAVGDSVVGNATIPAAGVLLRNLQGGGSLSIIGNGNAADVVTLIRTEDAETPVQLSADNLRVNFGLPESVEGILPDDDSRMPIALSSLKLQNNALAVVAAEQTLELGSLYGDESAMLGGEVHLSGRGSAYMGSYREAVIRALPQSSQTLRPDRELSLFSQSADTTLDFSKADARLRQLQAEKTALSLLNTGTDTSGSIQHHQLSLAEASSITDSAMTLSLGLTESAATLGTNAVPVVISGPVTMTGTQVQVNMLADESQPGNSLPVMAEGTQNLVLARLIEGGTVQNNRVELQGDAAVNMLLDKYYTNARLADDGTIRVDRVTQYYSNRFEPLGAEGNQGLTMMDETLLYINPQAKRDMYPNLAAVLDTLDNQLLNNGQDAANELMAAVTGASAAAMSAAVSGDMERQLRAMRNRVSTMGMNPDPCSGNIPELPAFHTWVNAEGDYAHLNRSGTTPGYTLSTWGGTLGLAVDTTPCLTAGLAFSYMHGDFEAKSAESADGNLDFFYINAFARYSTVNWVHSFIATLGIVDTELSRRMPQFHTEGKTDGIGFGFLYEVAYQIPLNETKDIVLQPLVNVAFSHTSLEGYSESGSDAGLRFGDSDMTAVTFGLGGRFVGSAGENLYNRKSRVEGRALLKLRAGDRDAAISSSLLALPSAGAHVRSAELGMVGVELGAGIVVPIGVDSGSLFLDASFEIASDYSEINGVIGYQIDF